MIEAKTADGHCELSMSGTGAELTEDMRVIIHAAYNAIMKSVPEFSKKRICELLQNRAFESCN